MFSIKKASILIPFSGYKFIFVNSLCRNRQCWTELLATNYKSLKFFIKVYLKSMNLFKDVRFPTSFCMLVPKESSTDLWFFENLFYCEYCGCISDDDLSGFLSISSSVDIFLIRIFAFKTILFYALSAGSTPHIAKDYSFTTNSS